MIDYRRATKADAFALLKLYQVACDSPADEVLLDVRKLEAELESVSSLWLVAEEKGELLMLLSILLDRENRLAKISRLVIDPSWRESGDVLKEALPRLITYLQDRVDVLYSTTRTLTLKQQVMTLGMGFKLLGIFPSARGADAFLLNGLTAYFFDDVLTKKRKGRFVLHPLVAPFFQLASRQCHLGEVPTAALESSTCAKGDPLPPLEVIHAPLFVSHRFQKLRERRSLSVHFYPFQEPNVLITDPAQHIEVFVKLVPEMRFAAIIGERLDAAVSPAELYDRVSVMLNERNVTYIEAINDVADPWGIEAIISAGYLPCGYFPAFKLQGEERRDFVILARSFERLFHSLPQGSELPAVYLECLSTYLELEEEAFLRKVKEARGKGT